MWLQLEWRQKGDGLAEELGGKGADTVEFILEPCILDAQVLLLQGDLPKHGRAAAAAAHWGAHGLPDGQVLRAQLFILLLQQRVLVPLQLRLGTETTGQDSHERAGRRNEKWIADDKSTYLHLRATVLEPELDLPRVEGEPLAKLGALLLVRVGALLEQPTRRG